jgi:uncharacterized repeat protein (TIGR03806 family)
MRVRVLLPLLVACACGEPARAPDSGPPDTPDASSADAAVEDAGLPDAGAPDAGAPDAGPPDAGHDAGVRLPDGGLPALVVPSKLSGLGLFQAVPIVDGGLQFAADLIPYELSTALFSDYAVKTRTLRIPEGAAKWSDHEVLDFPVGTVITKTFAYPADFRSPTQNIRVLETRLLVRQPTGWEAFPFVWDTAQQEATFAPGGRVLNVTFLDADGGTVDTPYLVPSKNQCQECHHLVGQPGQQVIHPIGPKARYLNFETTVGGVAQNQLERLAALGKLTGLPPAAQRPRAIRAFVSADGTLEERARTFLDINCAHCHRPESTAGITSRLFLDIATTDRFHLGECKRPGSAGNDVGGTFDILPGDHTGSILWFRFQTTESGKMMPAIGRALRFNAGADLLAEWIDSLPPRDCSAP